MPESQCRQGFQRFRPVLWAVNRAQCSVFEDTNKKPNRAGQFCAGIGQGRGTDGRNNGQGRAAQWLQGAGAGVQGCSYKKPKKRAVRTGKAPPPPKAKVVSGRGSAAQNRGGTLNPIISDVDLLPLLYEKGNDKNYVRR